MQETGWLHLGLVNRIIIKHSFMDTRSTKFGGGGEGLTVCSGSADPSISNS